MESRDIRFRVCVRCYTFNHAPYIEDAMNGFTMQQVTFPYVCAIVDDASTDGEPDLIRRYLQEHFNLEDKSVVRNQETDDYVMMFAQHKTNKNCFFAVFFLKYNHYSIKKEKLGYIKEWIEPAEYSAVCEGDDFWISSDFLELSVRFLDEHTDYSCVFGNRIVCDENATEFRTTKFKGDLTVNDIMHGTNMGLRNLCFRREVQNVKLPKGSTRDLYIYYRCAISGRMRYFDRDFAVYRYTGKGVCSSIIGREAIYTSYLHYYQFHQRTDFRYQEEYVNYQVRQMLSHLFQLAFFFYCIQLIHNFHVPSRRRYWWYIKYLSLYVSIGFLKKISCLYQK